jgi:hypothetical protein
MIRLYSKNGHYLESFYKVPFPDPQLLILRYLRMSGRFKSAHTEVSK